MLIDTPGFAHEEKEDEEVLDIITSGIINHYHTHLRISAELYLHRSIDVKSDRPSLRGLAAVKELVGEENYDMVHLVSRQGSKLLLKTSHDATGQGQLAREARNLRGRLLDSRINLLKSSLQILNGRKSTVRESIVTICSPGVQPLR
jgi:hypothetical protein